MPKQAKTLKGAALTACYNDYAAAVGFSFTHPGKDKDVFNSISQDFAEQVVALLPADMYDEVS